MVIELSKEEKKTLSDFSNLIRYKRRLSKAAQTKIENTILSSLSFVEFNPIRIAEVKAIIKNKTGKQI
jgi:hypothetical protein